MVLQHAQAIGESMSMRALSMSHGFRPCVWMKERIWKYRRCLSFADKEKKWKTLLFFTSSKPCEFSIISDPFYRPDPSSRTMLESGLEKMMPFTCGVFLHTHCYRSSWLRKINFGLKYFAIIELMKYLHSLTIDNRSSPNIFRTTSTLPSFSSIQN